MNLLARVALLAYPRSFRRHYGAEWTRTIAVLVVAIVVLAGLQFAGKDRPITPTDPSITRRWYSSPTTDHTRDVAIALTAQLTRESLGCIT